MPLYAHARIEDPNEPGRFYERGDEIPGSLIVEGLECVSEAEYDPETDKSPPPSWVEIDGVRYERKESPDA